MTSHPIDWKLTPIADLDRHKFTGRTIEGQTLTGYLAYEPRTPHGPACFDLDYMSEIIEQHPAGHNTLHPTYQWITVYKETKP